VSDSHRGFYIVATVAALFAAIIFGGAESRCQREQQAYQANRAEQPSGREQSQFRSQRAWMPCLVERAIANAETSDGTQHEQRDLMAQESSALWGFWIAVIALFQLVATAIGLVLIKRTLDATREAVQEAGDATEAARQAVSETSRVGEAQTRAYLSVVQASFHVNRPTRPTEALAFELALKFNNSGGTPAVNVSYFCEARLSTWKGSEDPPNFGIVPFQQFVTNKPPGKTSEVHATCFGVAPRWSEYIAASEKVTGDTPFGQMPTLIICGVVFYEDVFGKTFRSQFGFFFTGRVKDNSTPVSADDLSTIQACIPTFERIENRLDYIKSTSRSEEIQRFEKAERA
jgi:hypothetical protein